MIESWVNANGIILPQKTRALGDDPGARPS
jgi:hypothetical protein